MKVTVELEVSKSEWKKGMKALETDDWAQDSGDFSEEQLMQSVLDLSAFLTGLNNIPFEVKNVKTDDH